MLIYPVQMIPHTILFVKFERPHRESFMLLVIIIYMYVLGDKHSSLTLFLGGCSMKYGKLHQHEALVTTIPKIVTYLMSNKC